MKEQRMRPELKHLFSPLKIKSMELRNRIVMPPMTTIMGNADGTVSDAFIEYYTTRARGGAALITAETVEVHPYTHNLFLGERGFTAIYDDRFIPGLKRFTASIHSAGAKCSVQLHHTGRAMIMLDPNYPPLAPSPIPHPGGSVPRELTINEIEELVEAYAEGARRARDAGFDAVDVHGGHGYLIAQFMSAYSNRRIDCYGGDLLCRLRFPMEVLRAVRNKVGDDFPIIFRFSADERVLGGRDANESAVIAPYLVEAGADCLSITTGMHFTLHYTVPMMALPKGLNIDGAAAVKGVVDVPVIVAGRMNDPILAESVLTWGKADLIAIGRGLIADPELPNKLQQGHWDEVRPCLACNQGCIGGMFAGSPFGCMVNPEAGHELEMIIKPALQPKRILVAGGGPAGIEVARTAASRGHKVTLYEKRESLGGQFSIASLPPFKQEFAGYIKYMRDRLERDGVSLEFNRELTIEDIAREKPDTVVVATGGKPLIPGIPGIDGPNVVKASDVLTGSKVAGQNVLVAGGGLVGCETALFLDELGKNVTIVEQLGELASDQIMVPRETLLRKLSETDVSVVTSSRIVEIITDGVIIEQRGNQEKISGIDTIVLALGVESVNELAASIKNLISEVYVIGDAEKPGKALDAILAGARIGRQI